MLADFYWTNLWQLRESTKSMNTVSHHEEIHVQPDSGRAITVPDQFFSEVGDIVIDRFEVTPTGQVVRGSRSLLRPHAASEHSPDSYPTVGITDFMIAMANRRAVPISVPEYPVRDISRFMDSSRCQNPTIANFVADRREGIIEYSGNVCAAEIIADVCRAFPRSQILVVSPHTREAHRLSQSVREIVTNLRSLDLSQGCLPDEINPDEHDEMIRTCQLMFTTVSHSRDLGQITGTDIALIPIVIYTQAARAIDLMHQNLVCAADSAFRLIGLHCAGTKMSPDQIGVAMQVFGCRRLQIPSSGFIRSAIYVCSIKNSHRIRNLDRRETKLDVVIPRIHTCDNRNGLIADVALGIIGGGSRRPLNDQLQCWLDATAGTAARSVAIICRTFLHAARLVSKLPGWRIYRPDDSADHLIGLSAADRQKVEQASSMEATDSRIILPLGCLDVYLATADPEVLINAAGGSHAPTFPEFWFAHRTGELRTRLVVDFVDKSHEVTSRHSRSRMKEYAGQQLLRLQNQISPDHDPQLSVAGPFFAKSVRPPQPRRSNENER